ncbi:MAG: hypothetical protein A2V85_07925 [Chloroflexi bacterium RBG_16_72_14]|nr:MAG: hypothetical protein A2V85_07925 [Chloroflexi bacterium RBG_16_72_14]
MNPQGVPVSAERIRNCLRSASFWVNELPRYADRQQQRADSWAILAGVLASLTSLAIFPILTETSTPFEKAIVSAVALMAAICALIPRVKNYAELAGQARELSSRYGGITGDLVDLAHATAVDQEQARAVVTEFETIKEKKDALRGLPDRDSIELRQAETARRLAAEAAKAAKASEAPTP